MKKARSHFTYEQAATAKWLVKVKGFYQHEAAAVINQNQGRVSEAINGKRFPEAPIENLLGLQL